MLPALRATILFFLLTGLAWPAVMTALGQALFPAAANGSLIDGPAGPVGSRLIGQPFTAPAYLWGRPSAVGYNAQGSGGSNLGPTNPALAARRAAEAARYAEPPPELLLAASGSGLDPHLSPEAARHQAARIAAARRVDVGRVEALIEEQTERPLLGAAQINVLSFNLALDRRFPAHP